MKDDTNKVFKKAGWSKKLDNPIGNKLTRLGKDLEELRRALSKVASKRIDDEMRRVARESKKGGKG